MITVDEAIGLVKNNTPVNKTITISTPNSLGYILAETVCSPINMPPFPQSAMDGYAVAFRDGIENYKVIGEIPAGHSGKEYMLNGGEAVRIFTGALVPNGANVVVKQEIVLIDEDEISFIEDIKKGGNIRAVGEQIKIGEKALRKGMELGPTAVGFLCGIGVTKVKVFNKPKITIIATGSELVKPGNELEYGKIYESNSYMLSAGLSKYNYNEHLVQSIEDTYEGTLQAVEKALEESDVLILSGGISVGDYDFIGKALGALGIERIFYKVKQKPGKPLYFGKKDGKYIFALPGNPAAAMTSFYIYVLMALDQMSGKINTGLEKIEIPLAANHTLNSGRAHFLKSRINDGEIEVLTNQNSGMLISYTLSNAIAFILENKTELKSGDMITAYLI